MADEEEDKIDDTDSVPEPQADEDEGSSEREEKVKGGGRIVEIAHQLESHHAVKDEDIHDIVSEPIVPEVSAEIRGVDSAYEELVARERKEELKQKKAEEEQEVEPSVSSSIAPESSSSSEPTEDELREIAGINKKNSEGEATPAEVERALELKQKVMEETGWSESKTRKEARKVLREEEAGESIPTKRTPEVRGARQQAFGSSTASGWSAPGVSSDEELVAELSQDTIDSLVAQPDVSGASMGVEMTGGAKAPDVSGFASNTVPGEVNAPDVSGMTSTGAPASGLLKTPDVSSMASSGTPLLGEKKVSPPKFGMGESSEYVDKDAVDLVKQGKFFGTTVGLAGLNDTVSTSEPSGLLKTPSISAPDVSAIGSPGEKEDSLGTFGKSGGALVERINNREAWEEKLDHAKSNYLKAVEARDRATSNYLKAVEERESAPEKGIYDALTLISVAASAAPEIRADMQERKADALERLVGGPVMSNKELGDRVINNSTTANEAGRDMEYTGLPVPGRNQEFGTYVFGLPVDNQTNKVRQYSSTGPTFINDPVAQGKYLDRMAAENARSRAENFAPKKPGDLLHPEDVANAAIKRIQDAKEVYDFAGTAGTSTPLGGVKREVPSVASLKQPLKPMGGPSEKGPAIGEFVSAPAQVTQSIAKGVDVAGRLASGVREVAVSGTREMGSEAVHLAGTAGAKAVGGANTITKFAAAAKAEAGKGIGSFIQAVIDPGAKFAEIERQRELERLKMEATPDEGAISSIEASLIAQNPRDIGETDEEYQKRIADQYSFVSQTLQPEGGESDESYQRKLQAHYSHLASITPREQGESVEQFNNRLAREKEALAKTAVKRTGESDSQYSDRIEVAALSKAGLRRKDEEPEAYAARVEEARQFYRTTIKMNVGETDDQFKARLNNEALANVGSRVVGESDETFANRLKVEAYKAVGPRKTGESTASYERRKRSEAVKLAGPKKRGKSESEYKREIREKAVEAVLKNPKLRPKQKKSVRDKIRDVAYEKMFGYTPSDVKDARIKELKSENETEQIKSKIQTYKHNQEVAARYRAKTPYDIQSKQTAAAKSMLALQKARGGFQRPSMAGPMLGMGGGLAGRGGSVMRNAAPASGWSTPSGSGFSRFSSGNVQPQNVQRRAPRTVKIVGKGGKIITIPTSGNATTSTPSSAVAHTGAWQTLAGTSTPNRPKAKGGW